MFPSDWIIQHTLSRGARNHQNHCKSRHPQNHCKLIIKIIIANTQNCCHRPHYHCFQLNHSKDPNQNQTKTGLLSRYIILLTPSVLPNALHWWLAQLGDIWGHFFKLHVLEMRVGATMHLVALGKFSHNSHSRLTWCPDRRLLASVNSATIILVTRAVANIITLVNIIFVIIKIINIPQCTQTDLLLRSQSPCIPYSRRLFTFWIISIIVVMHCPFTIHNMSCHCIITIIVS